MSSISEYYPPVDILEELPEEIYGKLLPIRKQKYIIDILEVIWLFLKELSYTLVVKVHNFCGIIDVMKYNNTDILHDGIKNNSINVTILRGISHFHIEFRLYNSDDKKYVVYSNLNNMGLSEMVSINALINAQFSGLLDYENYTDTFTYCSDNFSNNIISFCDKKRCEEYLETIVSQITHRVYEVRLIGRQRLYTLLSGINIRIAIPNAIVKQLFDDLMLSEGIQSNICVELISMIAKVDSIVPTVDMNRFLNKVVKIGYDKGVINMLKQLISNDKFILSVSEQNALNHELFKHMGFRYNPLSVHSRKGIQSSIDTRIILWNLEVGVNKLRMSVPDDTDYGYYCDIKKCDTIESPGDYLVRRSSFDGEYNFNSGRVNKCLAVEYWHDGISRPNKTMLKWDWSSKEWIVYGLKKKFKSVKDFLKQNRSIMRRCKSSK